MARYLVDIFRPHVHSVIVDAGSADEAKAIVESGVGSGDFENSEFRPTDESDEVCVWGEVASDDFAGYCQYKPRKGN